MSEHVGGDEIPVGEWIDVPKGMIAAPNTYVDGHGVLRHSGNHAIAVWHNRIRGNPPCEVRVTRPDEICYDSNGAPWCPKCYMDNIAKAKIKEVFGSGDGDSDAIGSD